VLNEKRLAVPGAAYDQTHNIYYLGSLNRKKDRKMTRGIFAEFLRRGSLRLLPVLGRLLDPVDGTVWADTF